ncbi:MAG: ACP phosphodiesterase [Fibrobacterota bacterium]
MNFLAHLFLSNPEPDFRIGSLLGDFTSIPNAELHDHYNDSVAAGVLSHRLIDRFTDTNDHVKVAASLLFPKHRHFSRVALDVFFDHLLIRNWNLYSFQNFGHFVEDVYNSFSSPSSDLPQTFLLFLSNLMRYDVLRVYETLEGVEEVLGRMDKRYNYARKLEACYGDLCKYTGEIEREFLLFFPLLCAEAQRNWGWNGMREFTDSSAQTAV